MIGCIYHEADLDGVMSAAIVKKYFKGDIDLLPYNYGKEIPDVNKYDKVFVVDVSFGDRTRFRTRKKNVRHSWVKAGPGIQRCAICGITKQSEWRDGKTSICVHLSSGELYSMTGETPECRDLSEFY